MTVEFVYHRENVSGIVSFLNLDSLLKITLKSSTLNPWMQTPFRVLSPPKRQFSTCVELLESGAQYELFTALCDEVHSVSKYEG